MRNNAPDCGSWCICPKCTSVRNTPARLDADRSARPKTELVAHVREGVCFGPGCSPESWELRDAKEAP